MLTLATLNNYYLVNGTIEFSLFWLFGEQVLLFQLYAAEQPRMRVNLISLARYACITTGIVASVYCCGVELSLANV